MKFIILMGFIILITGCSTKEIIYQNHTIERIIEKECPTVECPDCIVPKCPDCNCYEEKCKTDIKTVIQKGCTQKLNFCNIRLDFIDDQLFECLKNNNTEYSDNLTSELDNCIRREKALKDILNNISSLI